MTVAISTTDGVTARQSRSLNASLAPDFARENEYT